MMDGAKKKNVVGTINCCTCTGPKGRRHQEGDSQNIAARTLPTIPMSRLRLVESWTCRSWQARVTAATIVTTTLNGRAVDTQVAVLVPVK